MVATTLDQYFHLAPQKDDQYCSAIFDVLLQFFCSYSIRGNSQIEGLLKDMKRQHVLPFASKQGQAPGFLFGNRPPWRAKDSKTLAITIFIVPVINIASTI